MVLSVKSVCPEFDRSINMRRILNRNDGGYEFSRLARDEKEADIEVMGISSLYTAADDWDEFLGERKIGSSSSDTSVGDDGISSASI